MHIRTNKLTRSLTRGLAVFNDINNVLELPEHIIRHSLSIYEYLLRKGLTSGRKREALIGACIYASCIAENYPIILKQLCKAAGVTKKEIIRQKKHIKQFVMINERISAESYIQRYGYLLNLSHEEITTALKILKTKGSALKNKMPQIKAASCLYIAAQGKKSMREISKKTSLSINAIFSGIKMIKTHL